MNWWENNDVFAPGLPGVAGAENGGGFSDTGKALLTGANELAASGQALIRSLNENVDTPRNQQVAKLAKLHQKDYELAAQDWFESMSASSKAAATAPIFGAEGGVTGNAYSLWLKLARTSPSIGGAILGGVAGGAVGGPVGAAAGVGLSSAGMASAETINDVYGVIDNQSDEELKASVPQYAELRKTMDEDAAREQYASVVRGHWPILVGIVTGLTGPFAAAGQVVKGVMRPAAKAVVDQAVRKSLPRRVARAVTESFTSEFAQEGFQDIATQEALIGGGLQDEYSFKQTGLAALEGGVLGVAGGGFFGARNAPRTRTEQQVGSKGFGPEIAAAIDGTLDTGKLLEVTPDVTSPEGETGAVVPAEPARPVRPFGGEDLAARSALEQEAIDRERAARATPSLPAPDTEALGSGLAALQPVLTREGSAAERFRGPPKPPFGIPYQPPNVQPNIDMGPQVTAALEREAVRAASDRNVDLEAQLQPRYTQQPRLVPRDANGRPVTDPNSNFEVSDEVRAYWADPNTQAAAYRAVMQQASRLREEAARTGQPVVLPSLTAPTETGGVRPTTTEEMDRTGRAYTRAEDFIQGSVEEEGIAARFPETASIQLANEPVPEVSTQQETRAAYRRLRRKEKEAERHASNREREFALYDKTYNEIATEDRAVLNDPEATRAELEPVVARIRLNLTRNGVARPKTDVSPQMPFTTKRLVEILQLGQPSKRAGKEDVLLTGLSAARRENELQARWLSTRAEQLANAKLKPSEDAVETYKPVGGEKVKEVSYEAEVEKGKTLIVGRNIEEKTLSRIDEARAIEARAPKKIGPKAARALAKANRSRQGVAEERTALAKVSDSQIRAVAKRISNLEAAGKLSGQDADRLRTRASEATLDADLRKVIGAISDLETEAATAAPSTLDERTTLRRKLIAARADKRLTKAEAQRLLERLGGEPIKGRRGSAPTKGELGTIRAEARSLAQEKLDRATSKQSDRIKVRNTINKLRPLIGDATATALIKRIGAEPKKGARAGLTQAQLEDVVREVFAAAEAAREARDGVAATPLPGEYETSALPRFLVAQRAKNEAGTTPSRPYVVGEQVKLLSAVPGIAQQSATVVRYPETGKVLLRFEDGAQRAYPLSRVASLVTAAKARSRANVGMARHVNPTAYASGGTGRDADLEAATSLEKLESLRHYKTSAASLNLGELIATVPAEVRPAATELFSRLVSMTEDVQIHVLPDTVYTQHFDGDGTYLSKLHRIVIPEGTLADPAKATATLAHELVHAALVNATIANPEIANAFGRIARAFRDANPEYAGQYAFTNVHEFIAEALTTPYMREALQQTRAPRVMEIKSKGLLRSLWNAFRYAVAKALGLSRDTTLLDRVLSEADNALGVASGERNRISDPLVRDALSEWEERRSQTGVWHGGKQVTVEGDLTKTNNPVRLQAYYEAEVGDWANRKLTDGKTETRSKVASAVRKTVSWDFLARRSDRLFGGAEKNPVRWIKNLRQEQRALSMRLYQDAQRLIARTANAARKYKGETWDNYVEMIMLETFSNIYADKALSEQKHLNPALRTHAWSVGQHAELANLYASMPEDLRQLRADATKFFTDVQDSMSFATLKNRLVLAALPDMSEADRDTLARRVFNGVETDEDIDRLGPDIYKALKETKAMAKINGPYNPLMRRGEYRVDALLNIAAPKNGTKHSDNQWDFTTEGEAVDFAAKQKGRSAVDRVFADAQGKEWFVDDAGRERPYRVKDADAGRATPKWRVTVQDQYTQFVDTQSEGERVRAELKRQGLYKDEIALTKRGPNVNETAPEYTSVQMQALLRTLEGRKGFKDMTPGQQNELRKGLIEGMLRFRSGSPVQSSRLPRKYVQGASKDLITNLDQYAYATSSYLASLRYALERDAAYKTLADMSPSKPNAANYDPEFALVRSEIRAEVERRRDTDTDPTTSLGIRIANRMLAVSFLAKLASPAYSVINSLQPSINTYPLLAARFGMGPAARSLMKAYADIGSFQTIVRGLQDTAKRSDWRKAAETTRYYELIRDRVPEAWLRTMLDDLVKLGAIDADAGIEIEALTGKSSTDHVIGYFEGMARQMPRAIEAINRTVTAVAAARLEYERNGGNTEKTRRYALDTVDRAQYNYSAENASPLFNKNHPLNRFAFQFKKFGLHTYQMLGEQVAIAMDKNLSKEQRIEAAKALGLIAGTQLVAVGALGLPFIELLKLPVILTAFVTGFEWEDVEDWGRRNAAEILGPKMGEVFTRGFIRAIPGGFAPDVSGRLGYDSLLLYGEPDSYGREDVAAYVAAMIGGAPVDTVMNMYAAIGDIQDNDFGKAMSRLPVKVVSDTVKAIDRMQRGQVTKGGVQSSKPYTLPEAAIRSVGFTPARDAERQAQVSRFITLRSRTTDSREAIMRQYAEAPRSERTKIWVNIVAWNRQQPKAQQLKRSQLDEYARRRKTELSDPDAYFHGQRVYSKDRPIAEALGTYYND